MSGGTVERVELVVRGGTVVSDGMSSVADIGISGDRIVQVSGTGEDVMVGTREIDARGMVVLPGLVDPHVHLCAPEVLASEEPEFVDDFHVGSRAAIAGGVTTFGQMSFPLGEEGIAAAIARDTVACREQASVDYFLHPATVTVSAQTLVELRSLAERGHRSLKLVSLALDWDRAHLIDAVRLAGDLGLVTLVHCEDHALIEFATEQLVAAGLDDAAHYPLSRPVVSERAAVERVIAVCELTGSPVYVVHLSSFEALEVCRRARARGLPVHVETRPLYLGLTSDVHAEADGAKYVGMPPVRERADVEALWAGLADGSIDTIGSDHAPWTLAQKLEHADHIDELRKGVAEIETMLPLLWTEGVRAGRITPERLVEVTSTNAARLFGLTAKGLIAPGADADLVVLDPDLARVVDGSTMQSRAGYSVYDGRTLHGWPRWTISRGEVLLDDGVITAPPGRGLHAQPAGPAGGDDA